MKVRTLILISLTVLVAASCGKPKGKPKGGFNDEEKAISYSKPAPGDSVIYGLACVGCTDSVVVLLPNAGGDPVTYNILDARRAHRIYGTPTVGDWIGVLPVSKGSKEAYSVVDLDELKGSWSYTVMPHLRDVSRLSKRQQQRILANMPDSIVQTYMIPRQYGFTLSRQSEASSIGMVRQTSDIEDDSPVEYPKVPMYTEWHPYNNRLILVQGRFEMNGVVFNAKTVRDTFNIVYMLNDSLALRTKNGTVIGFRRQQSARAANAKANAAAKKVEQNIQNKLK